MDAPSDAELMEAVKSGDRRAFRLLFDRYHKSVAHFAFRYVVAVGRNF